MKKILIALAVLAAASLTSCVQEQSFNDHIIDKNEVAFVLSPGATTRSAEDVSPVRAGITAQIGQVGDQVFYLEETITDLGCVAPRTKGTPIYTENVGTVYKNNLGVYATKGFGEATYETLDDAIVEGAGWRYWHRYASSSWPADGSEVEFYLRMPADGVSLSESDYSGGAMSFTYTSPTSASAQKDLIFAYAAFTESEHQAALPNGYPVTFYHALTAVKFAIANDEEERDEKGIVVTGITFTGLNNSGSCVVKPEAEGTAADPKVKWSNLEAAENNTISQAFTEADNDVTYDSSLFPSSFLASDPTHPGAEINKKDDASYTFWLIPQAFSGSTAVLTINYTMSENEEHMDIDLGEVLKNVSWEAGQLRTYTIRLDQVNVKIEDTVTLAGSAEDGYAGSTKTAVTITNTGNTDAYIRAAIVGQWLDANNNPVFGFTDEINNLYLVESWYEDQFVSTATGKHGIFTGLPGYKGGANPNANDWVLCKDGFYYYTILVQPEATADPASAAICKPLFTKYELKERPDAVTIAGEEYDVRLMHFELEIATQAVSAKDIYGNTLTWEAAWERALGEEPEQK